MAAFQAAAERAAAAKAGGSLMGEAAKGAGGAGGAEMGVRGEQRRVACRRGVLASEQRRFCCKGGSKALCLSFLPITFTGFSLRARRACLYRAPLPPLGWA